MATKLKRKYTCRPKHRRLKRTRHHRRKNTKRQKGGDNPLVDTIFGFINSRSPLSKTIPPIRPIEEEQREPEVENEKFKYIVFCIFDSFKSNILSHVDFNGLEYIDAYEFHNRDTKNVFDINEPINFENVGFRIEFRRPISNAYANRPLQELLLNRLIEQEDGNGVENLKIENLFFEGNISEYIILYCGYDNTFKLITIYSFENIYGRISIITSGFINNNEDFITNEHNYADLDEICTILENIDTMVNDKTIINHIDSIKIGSLLEYDIKNDSPPKYELSPSFIFKEFNNLYDTKLFPIYNRMKIENPTYYTTK